MSQQQRKNLLFQDLTPLPHDIQGRRTGEEIHL